MWGLFAETVLRVGSNSRVQEKKADPPQFSGMQLLELDLFIEQGKEILILPSRAVLTTAYLLPAQYLARFLRTPEQTNEFWNKHPSNQDDRGLSAEVLLVDLNLAQPFFRVRRQSCPPKSGDSPARRDSVSPGT